MATVHSHNGKFHVHKQVVEAAKKDNTEKETTLLKKDVQVSDHLTTSSIKIVSSDILSQKFFRTKPSQLSDSFCKNNYPPPKQFLFS